MAFSKSSFFLLTAIIYFIVNFSDATDVSYDGRAIKINGERKILFSGSIHYPRSTPEMWPELIKKAKEGGIDAIETYVFWNAHEPNRRQYNFDGNLDLERFIRDIQDAGLYAILRIGPYVCAEWNNGGLPVWLRKTRGMQCRTDNKPFEDEMQNFVTFIINKIRKARLLASQGGPIIIAQIENEYGNGDIERYYGNAGKRYVDWCSRLAQSFNIGVPWIMCQQPDAPQPMIDTCNGFYCDGFNPNNKNSPKLWTENWTGWFNNWQGPIIIRPAEDVAFAVARFFQFNGTLQNYYMYHGGTNFGRTSGGPYVTTSYDYDAPLDEYGNINQPKWGHLKELHAAIKMMEKAILYGDVKHTDLRNGIAISEWSGSNISSGCFLSSINETNDITVNYQNKSYNLPAWSVSILPNCTDEVFNTAKVSTQTAIMTHKPDGAQNQPNLAWNWRSEILTDYVNGNNPLFNDTRLLDQVQTTVDVSDYLWYITRVDQLKKGTMTLRVNTTGHGLYAFVNGALAGSQYASEKPFNFVFEQSVHVNDGTNTIALLSVTVGLTNYGAFFDTTPTGIIGGPVQLIDGNNNIIDLSNNTWSYKIGLHDTTSQVDLSKSNQNFKWYSKNPLPTRKPFTWYTATFQAPPGSDPVVLDLKGMGKGVAWINNKNIGRFWLPVASNVSNKACQPCDYRHKFDQNDKACRVGCGEPAQRRYHIPREYLISEGDNSVTLFEEAGGDPTLVSIQSIVVGTICGTAFEGKLLNLSCSNRTISEIEFTSFGDVQGTCQAFKKGSSEAPEAFNKVQQECVGKQSCSIMADESSLGACSSCGNASKRLVVQAVCS